MTVIVHNLAGRTISGDLEGGCIEPGIWEVVRGVDTNGDHAMDRTNGTSQVRFGRTESIPVSFAPHTTTILRLNRVEPGTPYWNRADLGICADDIVLDGDAVTVTVHSLGIIDAPAAAVALVDSRGREVQRVSLDTMPGLDGYEPVATAVHFDDVSSAVLRNGGIRIDPDGEIEEITERNNYLGMR
jgi:hypothetical protein